ncbi:hypothetical protein F8M41_017991 [Gigaspora margarita]|uniref:Uncharacterized protein n=1 Tax=Gigaspora margarita TaxID=4874 RepID=A0A8H4AM73_GIGMA|nr:hypothetical protein F8M41_017991 [Gigaspora margarita]
MLENSNSDLIGFFDEICKIIIPLNWSLNLQEDAKKKVVVIFYLIAGLRNMHANQFKLELGLYLAACGASCETINTLSNAKISVTNKTVYNNKKKIAAQHSSKVEEYFIKNKDSLCVYNIDDYHNIHEKRRPDDTDLSEAAYLATSKCKKIEQCGPVPVIFNGISVHNPVNIDASIICEQLINKYQGLFDLSYSQRKI